MFGAEFLNAAKSVTISTKDRPLVFAFRGEINVSNSSVVDRPATGTVTFSTPITTGAVPKIFLRFKSGRHSSMSIYMSVNGSPGNWTGFSIWAAAQGGGTLPLYTLEYVIARTSFREPSKKWGFQIMDTQSGRTLFSSDERVVRYSKFTKKWTQQSDFSSFTNWTPDVSIDFDDFIDTSFFNRGAMLQFEYYGMFCGLTLYRNDVRVLALNVQLFSGMRFVGAGSQFLCTPICKFPLDKYPA